MVEYTSIMKNDVWDIVSRPEGKLVVSPRWLYKIKHVGFVIHHIVKEFSLLP